MVKSNLQIIRNEIIFANSKKEYEQEKEKILSNLPNNIRVTESKIHFNNFYYTGNFVKSKDNYKFVETFKHKKKRYDKKTRT